MSTSYVAYFVVGQMATLDHLVTLNQKIGVVFADASWRYSLADAESLRQSRSVHITSEQFVREAGNPGTSPIASWKGRQFSFSLGFITSQLRRLAILEISENSLERLNEALVEQHSDVVSYLCDLYRTLDAEAMAMGPELEYGDFLAVLEGHGDTADVRVSMGLKAGQVPSEHASRAKTAQCGEARALVEWFPGCPAGIVPRNLTS